ncbi:cytochrome PufQ [Sulfitobacter sp. JB4-11]|uniref:cytochrome PufQ n=1 Tax=Sulfitobacter rhodophyticola TaxID=3238304 RepID=UPI00351190CF
MTDISNDHSIASRPAHRRSDHNMREYYVYFAVIFVATLPLSFLTWTLSAARRMELPEKGPIKAAWSQAQIITPRIFSA